MYVIIFMQFCVVGPVYMELGSEGGYERGANWTQKLFCAAAEPLFDS